MQTLLSSIYAAMPFLDVLMLVLILVKIILILGFRNFDLVYFVASYFRFYEQSSREDARNRSRRWYVGLNNYINYYTYLWMLLCVITYMAYGKFY